MSFCRNFKKYPRLYKVRSFLLRNYYNMFNEHCSYNDFFTHFLRNSSKNFVYIPSKIKLEIFLRTLKNTPESSGITLGLPKKLSFWIS